MNSVMGEYIDDFVLVYLDDILVFSTTEHEHENHLRLVFQQLREHKLQAKLKKCEFGKPRVKYLGYIVGSGEVHVDKIRLLQLPIGRHLRISRESSSFWVLPTTTIDSSLILLRWLPQLVTCYPIKRNSSGLLSSNVLLTP